MLTPQILMASRVAALLAAGWLLSPVVLAQPEPLTLAEAVETALTAQDPEFERFTARAEALEQRAVADAQLPDPKITAQVANVPTDSFEFDQ
ncbi:MAG: hypothetical protein COA29_04085, partial [Porticoccus sp.]